MAESAAQNSLFHTSIFPPSIGFSLQQSLALESGGSTEERHLVLDCMDTSGLSWARLVRFSWESWAGPNLIPSDTIPQKWNMEFRMSGLRLCQQHDLRRPKFLSSRYIRAKAKAACFALNTNTAWTPCKDSPLLLQTYRHLVVSDEDDRNVCKPIQKHNTNFHLEIIPSGWNDLSFSCLMICVIVMMHLYICLLPVYVGWNNVMGALDSTSLVVIITHP